MAVLGSVCCLDHDLCLAVSVQIIDHQLGIMSPGPDVHAKVDPPELRTVKLNGINIDIAGITGLGIILRIARAPQENDFIFSVAIEVSY
ncbi:hypothetical protein D3C80_1387930 [compost metagenome]